MSKQDHPPPTKAGPYDLGTDLSRDSPPNLEGPAPSSPPRSAGRPKSRDEAEKVEEVFGDFSPFSSPHHHRSAPDHEIEEGDERGRRYFDEVVELEDGQGTEGSQDFIHIPRIGSRRISIVSDSEQSLFDFDSQPDSETGTPPSETRAHPPQQPSQFSLLSSLRLTSLLGVGGGDEAKPNLTTPDNNNSIEDDNGMPMNNNHDSKQDLMLSPGPSHLPLQSPDAQHKSVKHVSDTSELEQTWRESKALADNLPFSNAEHEDPVSLPLTSSEPALEQESLPFYKRALNKSVSMLRPLVVAGTKQVFYPCKVAKVVARDTKRVYERVHNSLTVGVPRAYNDYFKPAAEIFYDVASHWANESRNGVFLRRHLEKELAAASSYREWKAAAEKLDEYDGHDDWKLSVESDLYDYLVIQRNLDDLDKARKNGDMKQMCFLVRSTLHRNLAGIGNHELYSHSRVGTKLLIEKYINEVCFQLEQLSSASVDCMAYQEKLDMFVATRRAYGRSALLLSGGGGRGLYHVGVLKALHEENLLPRIMSGSSIGSLVASVICVTKDEDLDKILSEDSMSTFKNTQLITRHGESESWWAKLRRFLTEGTLGDIDVLKECCRENIGDVTFAEAYHLTKRVLNITVNSTHQLEAPRLLNYLTAPDVVIWSAACASCALKGLFDPVEILVKQSDGELGLWNPATEQEWSDGSIQSDLPMQRLAEMFNVNHFIVSQVNPHVAPVLKIEPYIPKVGKVLANEVVYRIEKLASLNLSPALNELASVLTQTYTGDVTIVPPVHWHDYYYLLTNPTPERYREAFLGGQHSTWPLLSQIDIRMRIELTLDAIVVKLKRQRYLFIDLE